jgi:hypothetical protein
LQKKIATLFLASRNLKSLRTLYKNCNLPLFIWSQLHMSLTELTTTLPKNVKEETFCKALFSLPNGLNSLDLYPSIHEHLCHVIIDFASKRQSLLIVTEDEKIVFPTHIEKLSPHQIAELSYSTS